GTTHYADRHYQRARDYLQARNAPAAIQELKDALKLDPKNSNFHSLMGQAYLLNNLTGMAKVHFKQALRLDPTNVAARKYAQRLNLDLTPPVVPQASSDPASAARSSAPVTSTKGFLGRLFSNSSK
ncbi:MAG: Chaperone protein DnaJ, partial [Cyanobacteriota bacterium]